MGYFKLEKDDSGIYINSLSDDLYELNVTEGGKEDALIKLSREDFEDLVSNMKRMLT